MNSSWILFMNYSWIKFIMIFMNSSWRFIKLIHEQFMKIRWTYYWTFIKWWSFMNITVHELFMKKYVHEYSSTFFHEQKFMTLKCPIISSWDPHEHFMNKIHESFKGKSWIVHYHLAGEVTTVFYTYLKKCPHSSALQEFERNFSRFTITLVIVFSPYCDVKVNVG